MKERYQRNVNLGRRQFLGMSAIVCAAYTMCGGQAMANPEPKEQIMDAGPIGDYANDGVYDKFHRLGFFIIRKNGKLLAISSVCTHKKCKLNVEKDGSFYCDCHGSTFNPSGKVTQGPAKQDLPYLPTQVNDKDHLLVHVPA